MSLTHSHLDLVLDVESPLVEVLVAGHGSTWSGGRTIGTAVGARLAYQGHNATFRDGWHELAIDLADDVTGLAARLVLRSPDGIGVVRSTVELTNGGHGPLTVQAVTSFVHYGLVGAIEELDLWWADNDWLAECRWQSRKLRTLLVDVNRAAHQADPRGCFAIEGRGGWPSERYLPMGGVVSAAAGRAAAWQIEHSGGWRWEVGERAGAAYLALSGPADEQHHWRQTLEPGERFSSVPVAMAFADGGVDQAFGELTRYRRAIRRPHADHRALPVVFNDYMNTLMGDPSTERLLPLIDAAAEAGAEVFCIDAGWYDDTAGGWWDTVGAWEPASTRFPGGLAEVTDRIRDQGMVPGLWLEPEVVGVASPVADALPESAFFVRAGQRVVEHGRYHLDLRHPDARGHLDKVVDRLVGDFGVGYFKLDYNINAGAGTETGGLSAGAGHLNHVRAYYDWLDSVLDRHPGLVLENCASGGMRMDYGVLARAQLQSTSDQQDFLRYPPIAASAPAAVTPEQAAVWAYPQPGFTDDELAFTLCGALLGRVHLSGFLNRMSEAQSASVRRAIEVYREIRQHLPEAVPFWPLGLPGWEDAWLALGMRTETVTYVTVWHRTGEQHRRAIGVRDLAGGGVTAEVLYPHGRVSWDDVAGVLTVELPRTPSAMVVRLAS